MAHQYKRRTMDEAQELGRIAFLVAVADNLTPAEIEEFRAYASISGGSPFDGWEAILGHEPTARLYYEFRLYRPSDQCPYVEKIFARVLVPRDRSSDTVYFIWRPVLPPYTGPYFE